MHTIQEAPDEFHYFAERQLIAHVKIYIQEMLLIDRKNANRSQKGHLIWLVTSD